MQIQLVFKNGFISSESEDNNINDKDGIWRETKNARRKKRRVGKGELKRENKKEWNATGQKQSSDHHRC